MKKPTIAIFLCIGLILSSPSLSNASGESLKACSTELEACAQTLAAADEVIELGNALITLSGEKIIIQKEQIDQLVKETVKLRAKQDSLWRSPFIWLIGGLLIGGIAGVYAESR